MKLCRDGDLRRIEPEGNETEVFRIPAPTAREIVISEGFRRLNDECFDLCESLERIVLPESLTHLGSNLFPSLTMHVEILYQGRSDEWIGMAKPTEEYVSGGYDHYPYYSSYGSTVEEKRFDRCCNGKDLVAVEVLCERDGVRLYYGTLQKDGDPHVRKESAE